MLGNVRDPEQLNSMWTQDALRLLQEQDVRGIKILNRMNRMSKTERMAVFHKVKDDKDHEDKMRSSFNTHFRHLAQGVNDDLAQDAHAKRQFQDVEETKSKKKCKHKSQQGSGAKDKTSPTPTSTPTSAATTTSAAARSAPTSASNGASSTTASRTPALTCTSETAVLFDVNTARPISTIIMGRQLCEPFKQLQIQAAATVNDLKEKVSFANFPFFMAANYIWMSSTPLPGLTREAPNAITRSVRGDAHPLSESLLTFCSEFSSELAETGRVQARSLDTEEEEDLMLLYQNMSKKLPKEYFGWVQKKEDTFAHEAVDMILKHFFPENTPPYELDWASRSTSGSKTRRGDPLKSDATVLKSTFTCATNAPSQSFLASKSLAMLDNINVKPYLRTPPRHLPDELLPDVARPQPVNVTPSKRPFFADNRRSSVSAGPTRST
ncbi:MAG: hypothetical protein J3R72DRAFT_486817 [Linnemannia gamsii]|nr:MAG: hypothetical protein J3R72DRAFT_486817 [Linnemannia gamsii]